MTASSTTLRGAVILIVLYGLLHIFSSLYASLIRVGGGGLEGNTGPFTPVSMVDMGRAVVQCRRYCGRKFVADSRGFVCQWEGEHALDDQGCCNVTSLSTLVSPATMCLSLCKKVAGATNRWCCPEYEFCVACCQKYRKSFDQCGEACRTNSALISGISYKKEDEIHCFVVR